MKKLLLLLSCAFLIVSCNSERANQADEDTVSEQQVQTDESNVAANTINQEPAVTDFSSLSSADADRLLDEWEVLVKKYDNFLLTKATKENFLSSPEADAFNNKYQEIRPLFEDKQYSQISDKQRYRFEALMSYSAENVAKFNH